MSSDESLNRFEVIDHRGPVENHHRAMVVGPTEDVRIRVLEQDHGRTLKVVLSDREANPRISNDAGQAPEDQVDSVVDSVAPFRDAVASFLSWVDHGGEPDALLRNLSSLLHLAFALPIVEPVGADTDHIRALVKYSHVRGNVAERIRGDAYWVAVDPFDLTVEHVATTFGMISDDIVDIYVDLSHGVLIADQGSLTNAIWHWRFSFDTHWGRHAADAFNALYRLYH